MIRRYIPYLFLRYFAYLKKAFQQSSLYVYVFRNLLFIRMPFFVFVCLRLSSLHSAFLVFSLKTKSNIMILHSVLLTLSTLVVVSALDVEISDFTCDNSYPMTTTLEMSCNGTSRCTFGETAIISGIRMYPSILSLKIAHVHCSFQFLLYF